MVLYHIRKLWEETKPFCFRLVIMTSSNCTWLGKTPNCYRREMNRATTTAWYFTNTEIHLHPSWVLTWRKKLSLKWRVCGQYVLGLTLGSSSPFLWLYWWQSAPLNSFRQYEVSLQRGKTAEDDCLSGCALRCPCSPCALGLWKIRSMQGMAIWQDHWSGSSPKQPHQFRLFGTNNSCTMWSESQRPALCDQRDPWENDLCHIP